MKLTKTASGIKKLTLSKTEWTQIGRQAGWTKTANKWSEIPDETVKEIAKIAKEQGETVTTKQEAYQYALGDEDALELILGYVDL